MSRRPSSPPAPNFTAAAPRSFTTLVAFLIGIPLASSILYLIRVESLVDPRVQRYVSHPVECVEVVMFCCAVGALTAKLWGYLRERAACRRQFLPPWDGNTVPVSEVDKLRGNLSWLGRLRGTYLARRVTAVLDFVSNRRSAAELDDHLRTLADNDALALEGSYSLIRFITWAIPILGFLGTVLGITGAISGVTPEKLEHELSTVTDGLALAFDTTALALGLTMLTMFLTFLVERLEQSILDRVDRYADAELAHRFERTGAQGGEFVEVVREHTQVLIRATEQLVQGQAEVWARTLQETEKQWMEAGQRQQQRLAAALEDMLDRTLQTHTQRLAALEKQVVEQSSGLFERLTTFAGALRDSGRQQQEMLVQVVQSVTAQAEALARLQDGEKQLVRLQELLAQNLATLAASGTFEEAVQSLTAAIHLLTARAGGQNRLGVRAA
jgi:hypothetical protein